MNQENRLADIEILRDAAEDIREMLSDLNETKTACASCGLYKYENFDDHIVANTLRRLPVKLLNAAELLSNVQKYGRVGGRRPDVKS